jgi:S-formylglutathione hydrolase FrmB
MSSSTLYDSQTFPLSPPSRSDSNLTPFKGTGDNFYNQKQLLPENFVQAAKEAGAGDGVTLRMQPDYDHSYFFISTFGEDHVEHAAKYLLG